jgi:hypothetical protein
MLFRKAFAVMELDVVDVIDAASCDWEECALAANLAHFMNAISILRYQFVAMEPSVSAFTL